MHLIEYQSITVGHPEPVLPPLKIQIRNNGITFVIHFQGIGVVLKKFLAAVPDYEFIGITDFRPFEMNRPKTVPLLYQGVMIILPSVKIPHDRNGVRIGRPYPESNAIAGRDRTRSL